MQDGASIPEVKLSEYFAGLSPEISITWEASSPNDAVYREILEILFTPEPGETAA